MVWSRAQIPGLRWALAFIAAAMLAVAWAPLAAAQQDDQYDGTVAPSGPAAGEPVTVLGDTDGAVGPGDTLVIEGDFVVSEGASVTLEDSDGTQGTLIDGQNAEISEGSIIISVTGEPVGVAGGDGVLNTAGLFVVATTGIAAVSGGTAGGEADAAAPGSGAAASGGETGAVAGVSAGGAGAGTAGGGVAADEGAVADGAVVDDDVSAAAGAEEEAAGVAVLPDTGGSMMAFVLAGGLFLLAAGFAIRRFAGNN